MISRLILKLLAPSSTRAVLSFQSNSSFRRLNSIYTNKSLFTQHAAQYTTSVSSLGRLDDDLKYMEIEKDIARLQREIGKLYKNGEYGEALEASIQLSKISEMHFGAQHAVYASALNNIGICNKAKGNLSNAIEFYEKALTVYKEAVGDKHPSTLMTMNNLALCYVTVSDKTKGLERLGYLEKARTLAADTLEKRRKEFGKGHPHLAPTLSALAGIFRRLKKLDDATTYLEEAINILESSKGRAHLDTLTAINNMALIEKAKGNLDGAIEMYKEVLDGRLKKLSPEHMDVEVLLFNMAEAYSANKDYVNAMQCRKGYTRLRDPVRTQRLHDIQDEITELIKIEDDELKLNEYNRLMEVFEAICKADMDEFGPQPM